MAEDAIEMMLDVLSGQQREAMQPVIEQFWEFAEHFQKRDWGPAGSYFPAYPYGPAMPRYTPERRERMREFYYLLYPSQRPHDDPERDDNDIDDGGDAS